MFYFFLFLLAVVFGLGITGLAGYYMVWWLAKYDILFTYVEEGWCKIVKEWGRYHKTIGPGLHWVGLPGIYFLEKRKLKFMKCVNLPNGFIIAEVHEDEQAISSFKTTSYPYAVPFGKEEDGKDLPLSGVWRVRGRVNDYEKAFYSESDWYSEVNAKIRSRGRDEIVKATFRNDITGRDQKDEQLKKTLSKRMQEAVNTKQDNGLSVVEELLENVGFEVLSIELISIDPTDENLRSLILKVFTAEQEAEAERAIAQKDAEVGTRILRTVANRCGIDFEDLKKTLKENPKLRGISESQGGFREAFAYAEDQTKRDRAAEKGTLTDFRLGSTDGTPLPQSLQYLSTGGGGGGGVLFNSKDQKQNNSNKPGSPPKPFSQMTEDEKNQWASDYILRKKKGGV